MKTKNTILTIIFILINLVSHSQCKDSIYEKFSTTLPTQGGTWVNNSVVFGDSTRCGGTTNSCANSKANYVEFNGIGDYIRIPLITQTAKFYLSYKRSNNNTGHRIIVETSPNNTTWTTRLNITTITTNYKDTSLSISNVYVRIRDFRDSTTSTRLWYLDDVKWVWEANVGVWTGSVSADWNNVSNWCKGQLPTSADNVLIPTGTPYSCELNSGTGSCKNLTIQSGAILTVVGTLKIAGTITSTSNLVVRGGTIELNGSTAQTIKGSNLSSKLLGNLIISNTSGVSLGTDNTDTLKLLNSLTFTTTNATLTTGGALTLCSSDTLTARVGQLGTNRIVGDVVVERYIPNHTKAWQLMAVPTKGQTINSAWQEGNIALGNTKPGYGTIVIGTGIGFDITTTLPSVKTYNSTTGLLEGITNTSSLINTNKGYFVFVRGDRSVTTLNQPATLTRLRTTGTLYTPVDNPPPTINVLTDKYELVNNFYASQINFANLTRTGGVQNTFYVWDPKLTNSSTSAYGYGNYQTFVWDGSTYVATPGGGSYTNGNTNIESGNAFFVKSVGTSGTISFSESAKTTGSNLTTRTVNNNSIKTNLSVITNGEPILLDGVISLYGRYSNNIDNDDVRKIGVGEGISIVRNQISLTAEFRNRTNRNDTIFLNLISLRRQTYQLDINTIVNCKLVDNFLGTETNLTTDPKYIFNITTDPLSYSPNRFYIVLMGKKEANEITKKKIELFVTPNPVTNKTFTLTLAGEQGRYKVRLVNLSGKNIYSNFIQQNKDKENHRITFDVRFGIYKLVVEKDDTEPKTITLIIK